jgi:hypothetical protein
MISGAQDRGHAHSIMDYEALIVRMSEMIDETHHAERLRTRELSED